MEQQRTGRYAADFAGMMSRKIFLYGFDGKRNMKKSLSSTRKINIWEKTLEFAPLEVIITGFRIEDYLKDEFREKLEEMFKDKYDLRFSELRVVLKDKALEKEIKKVFEEEEEESEKEEPKKIILNIRAPVSVNYLIFRHRGERDYKQKLLIVSSDKADILQKFLESYGEVLKK